MDLIYVDESGDDLLGPSNTKTFALSAIAVPEAVWQEFFDCLAEWRRSLARRYGIYYRSELHASTFLRSAANVARRTVPRAIRANVIREALHLLEKEGSRLGLWVTNIRLPNKLSRRTYPDALERLVNRLNRTLESKQRAGSFALCQGLAGTLGVPLGHVMVNARSLTDEQGTRRAVLVFDAGHDELIRQVSRRLRVYNPIPSDRGTWTDTGANYKNIALRQLVGDPFFRDSAHDLFIQLADFVAFALLKHGESPTPRVARYKLDEAFLILDAVLNKAASRADPLGIVQN